LDITQAEINRVVMTLEKNPDTIKQKPNPDSKHTRT